MSKHLKMAILATTTCFALGFSSVGVDAASKTENRSIMGKSTLTAQQMADFVKKKNPRGVRLKDISVEGLAKQFIIIGAKEGVRGDVAFAQAIKETGFFKYGGDALPSQNNYSGIGTTGNGVKGHFFKTPRQGVTAQIQHLKAYASKDKLNTALIDPRFKLVTRGSATTWPALQGRWAMQPTGNYGHDILSIYRDMSKTPKRASKPVKSVKR